MREEETKKGMDAAQITGSASSYARKYALNGLFLIDDTKDPDATNTHGKEEKKPVTIEEKIAAAESKTALTGLWNTLSAEEQKKHTALFSKRKTEL